MTPCIPNLGTRWTCFTHQPLHQRYQSDRTKLRNMNNWIHRCQQNAELLAPQTTKKLEITGTKETRRNFEAASGMLTPEWVNSDLVP
jgi:hypothetical protein